MRERNHNYDRSFFGPSPCLCVCYPSGRFGGTSPRARTAVRAHRSRLLPSRIRSSAFCLSGARPPCLSHNFKGLPLLTLAALVVLGAITFLGPSLGPRVENASATQATVTVKHGETLWDIAQSVNPGGDVRDTVVRIMEMNSLTSTAVDAGQRLEVPKPRH